MTIELLLRMSKYRVVFAGDTAQTIAKGVSTKLKDTQEMLHKNKFYDTFSYADSVEVSTEI